MYSFPILELSLPRLRPKSNRRCHLANCTSQQRWRCHLLSTHTENRHVTEENTCKQVQRVHTPEHDFQSQRRRSDTPIHRSTHRLEPVPSEKAEAPEILELRVKRVREFEILPLVLVEVHKVASEPWLAEDFSVIPVATRILPLHQSMQVNHRDHWSFWLPTGFLTLTWRLPGRSFSRYLQGRKKF